MKHLKKLFITLAFAVFIAAPIVTIVATPVTYAVTVAPAKIDSTCDVSILGIPPWYKGMSSRDADGTCSIASPTDGKLSTFIWHIALNVITIGLYLAGYIAVGFVLFGGFQFLTGGDNPSKVEKARQTILNALIGLVISIASVVVVNLIFGIIG